MQEKVVPFGTKYKVTVESADDKIVMVVADEIKEGFILMGHGLKKLPKHGDKGLIVFERGGVKGGYWQYYAE